MTSKILPLLFLLPLLGLAQTTPPDIHEPLRQGDEAYDKSNFSQAETAYKEALTKSPQDAQALYNAGNAAYQQGHFPDAAQRYADAAKVAKTPAARADALHNLGNAQLKQKKYPEAVSAYEQSLRLRPGDPATKMNLQIAKKKLQQEKPPPPKQQQQQQQQQQQKQPPPPQKQKPQKQDSKFDMSKQEARRLLETAVNPQDQKNAQKYREGEMPRGGKPKKDW